MAACTCRTDFPLYLLVQDGRREYVPIERAGALMNSGYSQVDLLDTVLQADFSVREITGEERARIQDLADRADENK